MAYDAGTAIMQVVPSFKGIEQALAVGARNLTKGMDKALGAQLGRGLQDAAEKSEAASGRAGRKLGLVFAERALKQVEIGLANIPESDKILKPLRKELEALAKTDLGKGFNERDFIRKIEVVSAGLRRAQQDAQGVNAIGRYVNAGNAADALSAATSMIQEARKRGFESGDAWANAFKARVKAMRLALPDLKLDSKSTGEQRALSGLRDQADALSRIDVGEKARADNVLGLKVGVTVSAEDLQRGLEKLEAQLDQFVERSGTLDLVVAADKARVQAAAFFQDVKTSQQKAAEESAREQVKLDEQNAKLRLAQARRETSERAAELRAARLQQRREEEREEAEAARERLRAATEEIRERKRIADQNAKLRLAQARREAENRAAEARRIRERDRRDDERAVAEQRRIDEQNARLRLAQARREAEERSAFFRAARLRDQREDQKAAAERQRLLGMSTAGKAKAGALRAVGAIQDIPVQFQTRDVDREMAAIRDRIKKLGAQTINVDVKAEPFADRIQAEFDRLKAIVKRSDVEVKVKTDAARAATELGAILVLLNRIDKDKATVKVETSGAISKFGDLLGSLNLSLGRLGALIALGSSIGTSIVPAAAAATSAIGYLGTAALAAGSGIGVMLLGFSGIGDAVSAMNQLADDQEKSTVSLNRSSNAVAGGLDQIESAERSLASTRRRNSEAAQDAARAVRDAQQVEKDAISETARANADALERYEDAQRAAEQADIATERAQQDLSKAYAAARREIEDLNSAIRGNALDQRQAALDIAEAKKDLDEKLANPRATKEEREQADITYQQRLLQMDELERKAAEISEEQEKRLASGVSGSEEVEKAEQDIVDAQERAKDAARALQRAEQDRDRIRLEGKRKVSDAEQRITDAELAQSRQRLDAADALFSANQSLAAGQRTLANAYDRSGIAGGDALDNVRTAMGKLSPDAQKFATYIFGMRDAFFALRAAADPVLSGAQRALESLLGETSASAIDKMQPLFDFVERVATAVGDIFERVAQTLQGDTFGRFFSYISETAVPTLENLYTSFENLTLGFINLFLAFTPLSQQIEDGFLGMTESFRVWTEGLNDNAGFQRFLDYLGDAGPRIIDLLGALVRAVAAVVVAAAPIGDISVAGFTALFEAIDAIPQGVLNGLVAGIAATSAALAVFAGVSAAARLSTAGLAAGGIGLLVLAFAALVSWAQSLADTNPVLAELVSILATVVGVIGVAVVAVRLATVAQQAWSAITTFMIAKKTALAAAVVRYQAATVGATTSTGLLNGALFRASGTGALAAASMTAVTAAAGPLSVALLGIGAIWYLYDRQARKAQEATDGLEAGLKQMGDAYRESARTASIGGSTLVESLKEITAQDPDLQLAVRTLTDLGASVEQIGAAAAGSEEQLRAIVDLIDQRIAQIEGDIQDNFWDIFDNEDRTDEIKRLEETRDRFKENADASALAADALNRLEAGQEGVAESALLLTPTQQKLADAHAVLSDEAASAQEKLEALQTVQDTMRQVAIDGVEADEKWASSYRNLRDSINEAKDAQDANATSLSIWNDTGEQNRKMLKDLITAANDKYNADVAANGVTQEAIDRGNDQINQVRNLAKSLNLPKTATEQLIAAYRDIPTDITTEVSMDPNSYAAVYQGLRRMLHMQDAARRGLTIEAAEREWNSKLYAEGRVALSNMLKGQKKADGGLIRGIGGPKEDKNLVWASPGEFMQQHAAVNHYGIDVMEALNKRLIPKWLFDGYATGGLIQRPSYRPGSGPRRDPGSGLTSRWPVEIMVPNIKIPTVEEIFAAYAGGFLGGDGTVNGSPAMAATIKKAIEGVSITSAYRPGDPGYHGRPPAGRAIDMVFSDGSERRGGGIAQRAFSFLASTFGKLTKELIWDFSPWGQSVGIYNGQRHRFRSPTSGPGSHNDHIHWAFDRGGELPDTRQMPGQVMQVFHGKRAPDKVLTDVQWKNVATLAAKARESMRGGDTINFPYRDSTLNQREVENFFARRDELARLDRPNW